MCEAHTYLWGQEGGSWRSVAGWGGGGGGGVLVFASEPDKGDGSKFGCSSCLNVQISCRAAHKRALFLHVRFNFTPRDLITFQSQSGESARLVSARSLL